MGQSHTVSTVQAGQHRLAYREVGDADAPVVVLLHGLASDSQTWDRSLDLLAARGLRAIAVDLVGHGESEKPATVQYLLEDFADSLCCFLDALGIRRVALCGHSFGGAVAVAFAERHRDRIGHLVLVSAGGLGREVHPVLRAAALPVAPALLRLATGPRMRRLYAHPRLHRLLGLTPDNVTNLRRAGHALETRAGQAAFFASLRGVIEPRGQRGSFLDTGSIPLDLPVLIIGSTTDSVIPVAHARAAHAALPNSELVIFEQGRHEPHRSNAPEFAAAVASFLAAHPARERP
ncbi:MAG: alpha/beta fold hydrolase [Jatrophihabitans sp.]|uniref:alpha/beta fold hydrolase n=1 Tax=Jatrophihabitans sp. TaxID=1932789 RepID=UPI003F80E515